MPSAAAAHLNGADVKNDAEVMPGPDVAPVSEKEQQEVEKAAASADTPTTVTVANEGKDFHDTYSPAAPAPATGEAGSPLLCGPILRYTHQSDDYSLWNGSALIVLERPGSPTMALGEETLEAVALYEEENRYFYRFNMEVTQGAEGQDIPYVIHVEGADAIERKFHVPGKGEPFNIMFHSCNGFCDGADEAVAGLSLWADVLRKHEEKPFDVLVGGGDQIYCDGVQMKGAPLEEWGALKTGHHRAAIRFTKKLRDKVDQWYFTNHCDWFNTSPFRQAVSHIPSVNVWDDHDIIDGFGSYKDRWQRAPVFLGIGEIAWKYMCLFQQHINPNTISDPDPEKPSEAEVPTPDYEKADVEPHFIIHPKRGPYIRHRGISQITSFGSEMVFVGFDCRTDRTARTICNPDTYDAIFKRLESQVVAGKTKHLLVLLGVPIAYPRLVWLENAMQSPHLITPLRWINSICGGLGGVFNDFDGAIELLDDLQDHWTCGLHKKERNAFMARLQGFALRKQVRITILSGDVHLAAVGRFFSKKSLQIREEADHRYMVNVISSAITNAPPPAVVAQVLNSRNKLHHLDRSTDENLMQIWNVSVDNSNRINQTTYPARNFCTIELQSTNEGETEKGTGVRAKKVRGTAMDENLDTRKAGKEISNGLAKAGSLKVAIHIEVDCKSAAGHTKMYGFSIPPLVVRSK